MTDREKRLVKWARKLVSATSSSEAFFAKVQIHEALKDYGRLPQMPCWPEFSRDLPDGKSNWDGVRELKRKRTKP